MTSRPVLILLRAGRSAFTGSLTGDLHIAKLHGYVVQLTPWATQQSGTRPCWPSSVSTCSDRSGSAPSSS